MSKLKVLIFLLSSALSIAGCGELISSYDDSMVFGQNLRFGQQGSIDSSNVFSYTISGQCIGEAGTDVEITVGDPMLTQTIIPCLNNAFSTTMDLSSVGMPPGMVMLRAEHVGLPIQAFSQVMRLSPPPPPPVIVAPASGATLILTTQNITGTCLAGATVYISGDTVMGPDSAACDITGNFSVAITLTSLAGAKAISAYQQEFASGPSPSVIANYTLIVPPAAPVIISPTNNFLTNSVAQTITGTCEAGATVYVTTATVGAPIIGICSGGGAFSIGVTLTAGDGAKVIILNQTNAAGTSPNASVTVNLDSMAPVAVTIASPASGSLTNDVMPSVMGTCEAGATLTITGNITVSPVNTTCTAGGTYSVPVTLTASDGSKTISVTQTDAAGNTSVAEGSTFTLDATAPTVIVSSTAPSLTTVPLIPFQITFNEMMTGFVSADLTVVNGTVTNFTGGPSIFDIEVTPTTFGPVNVSVAANRAQDPAGNGNLVSNIYSVTFEAAMVMSVNATNFAGLAIVTQGAINYNVDWGDGTQSLTRPSSTTTFSNKTYSSAFTGLVRIYNIQPEEILQLRHASTTAQWSYNLSVLPPNLTVYDNRAGGNLTTGSIENLPPGLTEFYNAGSNTTSGNVGLLPTGLTQYINQGNNTTSGNIGGLPAGLINYENIGQNTTSGDIADLPTSMTIYSNQGRNTSTGNIANLKEGLITYRNMGLNTEFGDIGNLPSSLTLFNTRGNNTVSGNVAGLKPGLLNYETRGSNTTSGLLSDLPPALLRYVNGGSNTVTGDIANLPSSLNWYDSGGPGYISGQTSQIPAALSFLMISNPTSDFTGDVGDIPPSLYEFRVHGVNTVFGDIANIPSGLARLEVSGINSITGDIANLKASLPNLQVSGNNTISGDIANLKASLAILQVSGNNTISGDIASLKPGLDFFEVRGLNTTTGSINSLPASLRSYANLGNNTTTSTGTFFAPTLMWRFYLHNAHPRSQTEIDDILISLTSVLIWGEARLVDIRGLNSAAPSSAGLAAKAIIQSRGATVLHN